MGNELNIDEQLQADWLDAKLRDEMPYIDDAGFTARVVQQLPARRQRSRLLRAAILLACNFPGQRPGVLFSPTGVAAGQSAAFLFAMPLTHPLGIAGGCALVLTLLGAYFALDREGNQRALTEFARSIR